MQARDPLTWLDLLTHGLEMPELLHMPLPEKPVDLPPALAVLARLEDPEFIHCSGAPSKACPVTPELPHLQRMTRGA